MFRFNVLHHNLLLFTNSTSVTPLQQRRFKLCPKALYHRLWSNIHCFFHHTRETSAVSEATLYRLRVECYQGGRRNYLYYFEQQQHQQQAICFI